MAVTHTSIPIAIPSYNAKANIFEVDFFGYLFFDILYSM